MRRFLPLPMIAAVWLLTLGAAPAAHPYGFGDWQSEREASPVAVAPDGKTILYVVGAGRAKGTTKRQWFIISARGTARELLTLPKEFRPAGFATSARQLYGTLKVGEVLQIALWTIGAKSAHAISHAPGGVSSIVLSPDGSRFAATADPVAPDPLSKTRTVVENDRSALYVVRTDGSAPAFWCRGHNTVTGFAWSHDATRIAILQQSPKIGHHDVTGAIDICTASGTKHVADIANAVSNEIPYPGAGIAWADNDSTIVFLSTTTDVLTPDHVWTVPAQSGQPVDRTPDIPFSILALHGDAHGHVWLGEAAGVETKVVEFEHGKLGRAFANGSFVGLPATVELAAAPELLAFPVATPERSGGIAVLASGSLHTITHENDAALRVIEFGKAIRHSWTSADGTKLEAIVTFPPHWNGKAGKFLVLPHGGPEANDVLTIDPFSRIIASHGFVVMQPQYRGSTGYGSEHLQAIYQHFGDTAYRDVDAATTEAIAQGWADPNRLAMFGWSAGGFMTSWTVTQTNRYKAAIEGAGITEWLSFIMSSDVQQTDYDASQLSDGPEPFLKYSAVMFTKNVTTPLLILHGESDVRVPTYQGRELFILLKEEGKTVRMVTYPDSPHFPLLWEQRANVFTEILHWLDRYDP